MYGYRVICFPLGEVVRKDSNEKGIEAFDVTVRSSSTHIGIRKWIGFPIRIASIQYMSKMMNTDVYLLLLHDTNLG